ncbi:hypothetical protein GP2143_00662 [marine gamma proteobacterium HTCC2143]|jgi:hypothetical protein|uniref:DUF1820 domain-containing protein n=1 Tax=marine gamma proteobacterium HTCC2143 TaxID=247633 RepID=A0YF10_9GAMM|nr:hypothetical protein GP2143_00662 [marine gamma proteobacterium HTCC2143]
MSEATPIYKVIFLNQNKVYELYAKAIYQSEMYGFVEVEEFVFGEVSQMIVDPGEEKLKNEFAGVTRSYIPMHSIIRIDEVEKEGVGKIVDAPANGGSNVAAFPLPGGARPRTNGSD